MISFETAIQLAEEVLSSLEKLYQLVHPTPNTATVGESTATAAVSEKVAWPSLLQFRRKLLSLHAQRHLVTELVATGKLSESEAQTMVDAGSPSGEVPRAGTAFANILAWLQTNGPTIAQDIAAAIPIIISLITLFGGL